MKTKDKRRIEEIKKLNKVIRKQNKKIAEYNYVNAGKGYIFFMETLKEK